MRGETASFIVAACLALPACAGVTPDESGPAAAGTTSAATAPGSGDVRHAGARTYAGAYSCEGCVERTLVVTIFADGSYRLRELPARGDPVQEQGRWSAHPDAPDRLVLESTTGTRVLRRTAPDALTIVDPEGRELRGLVGGVLARVPRVDPLPVVRRVVGLYRSGVERVLVDCESGATLRVLAGPPGSPQAALDAAWSELAPRDDEAVLVVVRAHGVAPSAGGSPSPHEAISIDGFERATRNGRCGAAPAER